MATTGKGQVIRWDLRYSARRFVSIVVAAAVSCKDRILTGKERKNEIILFLVMPDSNNLIVVFQRGDTIEEEVLFYVRGELAKCYWFQCTSAVYYNPEFMPEFRK